MTQFSRDISLAKANDKIIDGLRTPQMRFYIVLFFLAGILGWGISMWVNQVKTGMVVTGLNNPVGWGTYITNFVFWIGIAHSGTLISAILYLMRSQWRNAVSRATEAMTVIAVMTAGMFPLIHLGRVWVFYYLVPYPNQRALYPNYMSPLVWDLIAVLTYFTVSAIFFFFGVIPDAASVRDRYLSSHGEKHWKTRFFSALSLGWSGNMLQWRHYNRSYLLFALLATPLVVSVHSIVSWDFASSLLPGWHSTIFAPYFVAGAIHSGLAMALTLLIPLRKFLNLKEIITNKHLETVAKTMLVTCLIIAYTYAIEPAMEHYSGNKFSIQFSDWRFAGGMTWIYILTVLFNVFVPLTFIFRRIRHSIKWLFIASILVNIGMWLERYFIVVGSTSHDFMPHAWDSYTPRFVEISITAGLTSFFFLMFIAFSKLLPTIPIADYKEFLLKKKKMEVKPCDLKLKKQYLREPDMRKKMLIYSSPESFISAVSNLCRNGFSNLQIFSPMKVQEVEKIMGLTGSPVSYFTLAGGIAGLISGAWLTIGSVRIYDIVVGGKPPVSITPYVPITFELTILGATLANLFSVIYFTRLYRRKINPYYDPRFSNDKFGILLTYDMYYEKEIESILKIYKPDEQSDKE